MAVVDVVKWDAYPGVFAWKFPSNQLSNQTRLIVSESQEAVLIQEGHAVGPFGPGTHVLDTRNYPVLTSFIKMFTGGITPFTAEVWFIQKTFKLDIKWGTSSAIQVEDPKYHIILPVRAFGQYGLHVVSPAVFLTKMVGTMTVFVEKTLVEYFRGIVVTRVKDLIGKYLIDKGLSVLQLSSHLTEISKDLEKQISDEVREYGMEIVKFNVSNISTDEKDPAVARLRQARAQKAEMDLIGYNYQQTRSVDTMETAAGNKGAGGIINAGIGMGMGMGMGVPMGNAMGGMMGANFGGMQGGQPQNGGAMCPACHAVLPAGAAFCPGCGKKVEASQGGSFCSGCGKQLSGGVQFCPFCGKKQN